MEQTWCRYGPNDPVSLADVRQTGATGVVIALHHIPSGEVWSIEEILRRKAIVKDAGPVWSVIESVPTHEDIKAHTSNYEQWIANCQQTLCNLTQCGIRTMCYNFMPMPNWTRTDLEYVLPDSSKAPCFDQIEFVVSEIHVLKHLGVEADHAEEEIAQAIVRFATMSDEDKVYLARNIIAGLPGAGEGYTLDQFRKHLKLYKDIDKVKLREDFTVSLKVTIPVAEEIGVRMVVHSDDPPCPIPSPSRIVPTIEDMQWMADTVNSMANGFTMCTGSHGVYADNDLANMIKRFGPRIYFTHPRSTMREDNPKTFHKAAHLNGNVDMYEVVKAIVGGEHHCEAEGKEGLIPTRPDHGHQMLGDLKKKTNPGCSAIGRLKGLAEVRGIELAI